MQLAYEINIYHTVCRVFPQRGGGGLDHIVGKWRAGGGDGGIASRASRPLDAIEPQVRHRDGSGGCSLGGGRGRRHLAMNRTGVRIVGMVWELDGVDGFKTPCASLQTNLITL